VVLDHSGLVSGSFSSSSLWFSVSRSPCYRGLSMHSTRNLGKEASGFNLTCSSCLDGLSSTTLALTRERYELSADSST
jgi:hypothetical protein